MSTLVVPVSETPTSKFALGTFRRVPEGKNGEFCVDCYIGVDTLLSDGNIVFTQHSTSTAILPPATASLLQFLLLGQAPAFQIVDGKPQLKTVTVPHLGRNIEAWMTEFVSSDAFVLKMKNALDSLRSGKKTPAIGNNPLIAVNYDAVMAAFAARLSTNEELNAKLGYPSLSQLKGALRAPEFRQGVDDAHLNGEGAELHNYLMSGVPAYLAQMPETEFPSLPAAGVAVASF